MSLRLPPKVPIAVRIAACHFDPKQAVATSVKDLLVDLAHLSDAERLDFVEIVKKAINAWQVERIDPMSVADGPVVEIYVGTEGLPPKPAPAKRPDRRKKSRPALDTATFGRTLSGPGPASLHFMSRAFRSTIMKKEWQGSHGAPITADYLDYVVNDVRSTFGTWCGERDVFQQHGLSKFPRFPPASFATRLKPWTNMKIAMLYLAGYSKI
jgi:hypothetical protein